MVSENFKKRYNSGSSRPKFLMLGPRIDLGRGATAAVGGRKNMVSENFKKRHCSEGVLRFPPGPMELKGRCYFPSSSS
jgi:hypothetical protein